MLNQSSNRRESSDEDPKDDKKTRPRTDWKRISSASSVLITWAISFLWDVINDKEKRKKAEKSYRIGKACGKISILIQKLQLPADLPDADSYKVLLWRFLKDQGMEKVELQPATTVANLDLLIDKALAINCIHSLELSSIDNLVRTTCAIADQWMVWVLVFCSDPLHVESLEQTLARTKCEYPIFVIPFV